MLLFARWSNYVELGRFDNGEGGQELGEPGLVTLDGVDMADKTAVKSKIGSLYQDSIREFLDMGRNVVIVYPQPEVGWDVPNYLAKSVYYGVALARPLSTSYKIFADRSHFAYSTFDAINSGNLIRIKPESIFCNTLVKDRCAAEDGTVPFYSDDNHVNSIGASMLSREIVSAMRANGWL